MGNDGDDADTQHTSGIPYTRTVHGHIADFVGHARFVGFVQVFQLKAMATITAAVALEAASRFAMPVDQLTLTGSTFDLNACHQNLTGKNAHLYCKWGFNSSKA